MFAACYKLLPVVTNAYAAGVAAAGPRQPAGGRRAQTGLSSCDMDHSHVAMNWSMSPTQLSGDVVRLVDCRRERASATAPTSAGTTSTGSARVRARPGCCSAAIKIASPGVPARPHWIPDYPPGPGMTTCRRGGGRNGQPSWSEPDPSCSPWSGHGLGAQRIGAFHVIGEPPRIAPHEFPVLNQGIAPRCLVAERG